MKISLNWIKEFVDLKGIDIKDIVSRFSLATAEIEGYEEKGKDITGVVVGEILTHEKHPISNKPLSLLTVDIGAEVVPVVCGAPNCRVGMKVALAKVGAKLGTFEIGKAKLAGYDSHGMCCGGDELGISADHSGIVDLDPSLKNGTPISEAIPEIFDTVIEIDNKSLTNRPDLWGHYGIAREFSVIFGKPLKPLKTVDLDKFKTLPKIPVTIENKNCLSYGAIRVDNVTRKNSPLGMQVRLFYCGMNAHNFLVDVTNYIMLETGQPNHAFDASKVNKLSIGNSNETNFVTLKDQTVDVKSDMLFIKSDGHPVALAGVIGGKNSEIDGTTHNCVFEFATFDAACVRKTASAIGVRTDASNRFEKSLDVNLNALAAARTLHFIESFDRGAKVVSNFNHVIKVAGKPVNLTVKKDYLERFCGISFGDYKKVQKNLEGLGFAPVITEKEINVTVPSWRATKDVTCEADIIEEIVRAHGYDNIKAAAPLGALMPTEKLEISKVTNSVKDTLSQKYGFDEVHSYVWNDTKLNKQLNIETPSYLKVINSCIKDNDAIRSEMMPTLIGVASKSIKQFDDIRIFEIGRVIADNKKEQKRLGILLYSKKESAEVLYKKLADILRDLFGNLRFDLGAAKQNYLHPKNNAVIEGLGTIGIIHPGCLTNAAVAEINLEMLPQKNDKTTSVRVSKYPKTTLDFTFTTEKVYGDIEKVFFGYRNPLCMNWCLKDVFAESGGKTSYTLTFTVGSFEKTLESAEIDGVWKSVVDFARKSGLSLKEQ